LSLTSVLEDSASSLLKYIADGPKAFVLSASSTRELLCPMSCEQLDRDDECSPLTMVWKKISIFKNLHSALMYMSADEA
jgi:hypothetical protein